VPGLPAGRGGGASVTPSIPASGGAIGRHFGYAGATRRQTMGRNARHDWPRRRREDTMIIENERDVTPAVVAELQRAADPRFKEIMTAFIRHLHDFAREVKLTELEFQAAVGAIVALGQKTNETHNEVVLMSGSLGFSQLICLLNNGQGGEVATDANLLGPFWRAESPPMAHGESIVRSPTPGPAMFVNAWFKDRDGKPIAGAEVDIWHSSPEGFYENQDPVQADMNLRGKFVTDADGHIAFRSVLPAGYPIPIDGPTGDMLRALGRHNMRPAHLHFLTVKTGFKTLISQIYVQDDKFIESDVQFGVTRKLIGDYVRHDGPAPAPGVDGPWYSLDHTFIMERGETRVPKPPISGKARGERPQIPHLA
jgi:hydroxyquinol 1,2-dioxygenase